jgi:calcineurin-like phosphoesterase family protein
MPERFSCADPHFSHKGMVMFTTGGKPIRPWGIPVGKVKFDDLDPEVQADIMRRVEEMDEAMVENWNRVVGPKDKVEVLGDVIIGRTARHILGRLNGRKRLRMGNHDIFVKNNNQDYAAYFEEITAYKVFDDLIMSHIPLHPESVKERWKANVHGHLHSGRVMMDGPDEPTGEIQVHSVLGRMMITRPTKVIDPRYLCVSMEHIDYTPIHMDEVYRRIDEQQEVFNGSR